MYICFLLAASIWLAMNYLTFSSHTTDRTITKLPPAMVNHPSEVSLQDIEELASHIRVLEMAIKSQDDTIASLIKELENQQ